MEVDWDEVNEAQNFTLIPEGSYTCKVTDVEEKTSSNDNEMWNVTWEVLDGEFAGRKVFDRVMFTEKSLPRCKLMCAALGMDMRGRVNLTPELLLGRSCILHVEEDEYEDKNGKMVPKNSVPFGGFEPVDDDGQNAAPMDDPPATPDGPRPLDDSDIPFAWLLPLALLFGGLGNLPLI